MGARGYTCGDSFTYARGKDIKKSAEEPVLQEFFLRRQHISAHLEKLCSFFLKLPHLILQIYYYEKFDFIKDKSQERISSVF